MSPFTISQLWQDVDNAVKVYSVKHTEKILRLACYVIFSGALNRR